jgi:sugar phosphate isomerase/epimerase
MKISTENFVFRDAFGDDEEMSFKLLAEAGFDAVDYSLFDRSGRSPQWLLADDYPEKAARSKELLAKYALECYQTHTPFRLAGDAPWDESNPDYQGIIRAIEYSGIIGASCAVVHALTPPAGVDVVEFNVPFYKQLAPVARKAGVKIAIENLFMHHPDLPQLMPKLYLPSQLISLLDQLDPECFTICLDTGHTAICGIEPDEFLDLMAPSSVEAVHIHDNNRLRDMHQLPYLCDLNWEKFLAALKRHNFRGIFNMELIHFFGHMPKELYPTALKLAAETGRWMTAQVEK